MNNNSNRVFALDIGTRSVVGLILVQSEQAYKVVDVYVKEHLERSMIDGQIHDIIAVSETIAEVKAQLEVNNGPLDKVAVAAAGRSLKTVRTKVEQSIVGYPPISADHILTLELSCVQKAQQQLAAEEEEQERAHYYCIGYSVMHYYLDDSITSSLIDQSGEKMGVEVIATFLPRIVIDNLVSALNRAHLTMDGLTLEPIAAIHVLVPPSMRRLNVALVDIGAGTSDIAITQEGAISAYGMVPHAGDEITDALSQAYLLDFPVAEKLKRNLSHDEEVTFTDILGFEHQLTKSEVVKTIYQEIGQLAQAISRRILELNGKPPQAILLIGGGSLTPAIGAMLANALNLPENRVAVRGVDAIQTMINDHPQLKGPEMVTPIGIAVTAREYPVKHLSLTVNGRPLRLFDLRTLTLGDALIAAGIPLNRLHGKPGLAMTVNVNGRLRIIPGTHGTPPEILQNGEVASLDSPIQDGDQIEVIPGQDGVSGEATIKDIIDPISTLDVYINEELHSFSPSLFINGVEGTWEQSLQDRDQIEVLYPQQLKDLEKILGPIKDQIKSLTYTLNGEFHELILESSHIKVNEQIATSSTRITNGDRIQLIHEDHAIPMIRDVIPEELRSVDTFTVSFNGETVNLPTEELTILVDGEPANLEQLLVSGASITVKKVSLPPPIYSDIFRYVDYVVPSAQAGHRITIMRNGEPSSLNELIFEGDQLEINLLPIPINS